jgi:tetratricopeptide (TPR) repeat protein
VTRLWGFFRQLVRRRPVLSLAAVLLTLLLGTGLGLFLWVSSQLRGAERAVRDGRPDDARSLLAGAQRVWPETAATHRLAARIERLLNHYPEAERHLQECRRLEGGSSEATQLEWLLLRAQRGEVDEVVPGLWVCVQQHHPESSAILEALASTYVHSFRLRAALDCLNTWLEREPDNVRALDWRGWVHEKLDHPHPALADYQRALEVDPGRTEVRIHLASLLVDLTDVADALPHLEQLRQSQPKRPEVLVGLGRCRMLQGRHEEARQLLDAALREQPDFVPALLHRGKLEVQCQAPEQAEAWFRRALALDPVDIQARYALANCLAQLPGREAEADAELNKYAQTKADLTRLRELVQNQLEKTLRDPVLAAEAGTIFLRLGQDALALQWLQRALDQDPANEAAHAGLAAYYRKVNQPEKAAMHEASSGAGNERPSPRAFP